MKKSSYHVLGVMSGTSLDGIDLAEIWFNVSETGTWKYTFGNANTIAYASIWKEKLQTAIHFSEEELSQLNEEYTVYLGGVISEFIKKNAIKDLDAVCSHGHTILHQPENEFTLQIGNLPKISEIIQQTVVCDFRVQDVALDGQGAPLVPIGDRLLFPEYDYCLNLGGFANVSLEKGDERIAYDICPVNIVLNKYAEQAGVPFDEGGKLAKSGAILPNKYAELEALTYYTLPPPKSLGLEWVLQEIVPILNAKPATPQDTLKTFTAHAAAQIAAQFNVGAKVLITGGGAYNDFLLQQIKKQTMIDLHVPDANLLEFKEALIFGLLGVLRLREEINCLSSVTGAKQNHSSGNIFYHTK